MSHYYYDTPIGLFPLRHQNTVFKEHEVSKGALTDGVFFYPKRVCLPQGRKLVLMYNAS
jgi:hypothetical protein